MARTAPTNPTPSLTPPSGTRWPASLTRREKEILDAVGVRDVEAVCADLVERTLG